MGYSWISHCNKELNFIKSEASTPIIFYDLMRKTNVSEYRTYENTLDYHEQNENEYYFQFGGSLKIALTPHSLKCDMETGRLYYRIPDDNKTIKCSNIDQNGQFMTTSEKYGVIGSHLLLRMTNEFQIVKMMEIDDTICYQFEWN